MTSLDIGSFIVRFVGPISVVHRTVSTVLGFGLGDRLIVGLSSS